MFKHVLLPTDGSASSDIAIQSALKFAKEIGARATGMHVIPPYHVLTYRPDMLEDTRERYAKDSEAESAKYLLAIEQRARDQGVPCETMSVKAEDVHEAIIQAAFDRQCDLIAMASHGRKGVRGLLLGSVTQKVLTHSQIPVLVFR